MAKAPSFDELFSEVHAEVIGLCADFAVLERLVFPLINQQLLLDHFRFLIFVSFTVSNGVVMTLCRLFENKDEPRRATLANVLRRVQIGERATREQSHEDPAGQEQFLTSIPGWVTAIARADGRLAIRRSALLAHRDLTKKNHPGLVLPLPEIRSYIELAKTIVLEYLIVFHGIHQVFDLPDMESGPQRLLEWARLDDYARHYEESTAQLRRRIERGEGIAPA